MCDRSKEYYDIGNVPEYPVNLEAGATSQIKEVEQAIKESMAAAEVGIPVGLFDSLVYQADARNMDIGTSRR